MARDARKNIFFQNISKHFKSSFFSLLMQFASLMEYKQQSTFFINLKTLDFLNISCMIYYYIIGVNTETFKKLFISFLTTESDIYEILKHIAISSTHSFNWWWKPHLNRIFSNSNKLIQLSTNDTMNETFSLLIGTNDSSCNREELMINTKIITNNNNTNTKL